MDVGGQSIMEGPREGDSSSGPSSRRDPPGSGSGSGGAAIEIEVLPASQSDISSGASSQVRRAGTGGGKTSQFCSGSEGPVSQGIRSAFRVLVTFQRGGATSNELAPCLSCKAHLRIVFSESSNACSEIILTLSHFSRVSLTTYTWLCTALFMNI